MSEKQNSIKFGLLESLPLAIAIAAYGLSYGVLTNQTDLSILGAILMSMLVFSGSIQLVTVAMLITGATLGNILLTSILLNLRNLLYGAALAEGLAPAKKWKWLLAFGVSDEPFVLSSARFKKFGPDPIYFGIVTAMFYIAWVFSSLFGAVIGDRIDPLTWGLDLAFPVTFAALLIPGLKEKPVIATAVTAVIIAFIIEYFMPGNEFTIIITGILSPFVGLYLKRRSQHV